MKNKPSIFGKILSSEQEKNRNWQDALDSQFSNLMDGFSFTTKVFIGFLSASALGGAFLGAKVAREYFQNKRQEDVALRSEAVRLNLEKILSGSSSSTKMMTLEEKKRELKKIRDNLTQIAKKNPKNIYGYEAAQTLVKLYIDEAIKAYDERMLEAPSIQEINIQKEANLSGLPDEVLRAYHMVPRSAESNAYYNASQWLLWSIAHAPDEIMLFRAQEKLVRVFWAIRQFDDAFKLLETMDKTGDRAMRIHELKAKFLKIQNRPIEALKEYELALSELDKNIALFGEKGLTEMANDALKIKRTALECNIAALKATEKMIMLIKEDKNIEDASSVLSAVKATPTITTDTIKLLNSQEDSK